MANQFQLVIYEGYLVAEPEMRFTPKGQPVTNFRMASNKQYKNSEGEDIKEVTWLKVTVWGRRAETMNQWLGKGSHVIVTGTLRVNEEGYPVVYPLSAGGYGATYEITATDVRILKGKGNKEEDSAEADVAPEEIPF